MSKIALFCFYLNVVLLFNIYVNTVDNLDINSELKNCTCVPFYQCSDIENGFFITDGAGLIDVRNFEINPCNGLFDVCCNILKNFENNLDQNEKTINKGCGYQKNKLFPWLGALFFKEFHQFGLSYKCGVSIIHENVVITAAHCLNRNGIWAVKIANSTILASKIIIHPLFDHATLQNDIALIILKTPLNLSSEINPICIPPPGSVLNPNECQAVTSKNYKNPSIIKLPLVERENCLKTLRTTRLGTFFQLHHSFLCAGGQIEKDTCGGDGGNPLICSVPGQPRRYHQVGIVSWGIGCGENNIPGIYVKLQIFREWIDAEMKKNHLDINSYRY